MTPPAKYKRSVVVSIASDVVIAVIKVVAAVVSGSSAMVSEAIHSCVDACNSVFLLVGIRAGRRPPDAEHPFGHGRETYFWTLIVAVSIFAGGGAMSFYEGITHLLRPHPLAPSMWSYIVLGVAAVCETVATLSAYREYRSVKRKEQIGQWRAFRASKDLTTYVVLFENGAAVIGVVIAFLGISATHLFGSPYPDGVASLLIGVLLGVVAFVLIRESKGLLIGEGVDARTLRAMRAVAAANVNVEEVLNLMTLQTGPGEVLVVMDLRFRADLTAARLVDVIDEVESALRARYPDVTRIFIEADRIVQNQRAGAATSGDVTADRGDRMIRGAGAPADPVGAETRCIHTPMSPHERG